MCFHMIYRHYCTPVALLLLALCSVGCTWTDARGTHHLIVGIGFGIITSTNHPGVEVRDSRILGAELSPEAVGVGYLGRHRVVVDPALASNVVVSVKASPLDLTVTHYDLNATNFPPVQFTNQTTNPTKP